MSEEDILQDLDRQSMESRKRVRALILEKGRHDVLSDFDRNCRDLDSGVYAARSAWHSISPAQRRTLECLEGFRRHLRWSPASRTRYDAIGEPGAIGNVAGIATVRNLAARELIAWDGGAFQPESKAILTERGQFVLKHGRPA